jgi:hypothetical protein
MCDGSEGMLTWETTCWAAIGPQIMKPRVFDFWQPQRRQAASGYAAKQASQTAERVDQPSGEHAILLLRLDGWKSDKQYDMNNLLCIHFDFRWKISQHENIRARHIC